MVPVSYAGTVTRRKTGLWPQSRDPDSFSGIQYIWRFNPPPLWTQSYSLLSLFFYC